MPFGLYLVVLGHYFTYFGGLGRAWGWAFIHWSMTDTDYGQNLRASSNHGGKAC